MKGNDVDFFEVLKIGQYKFENESTGPILSSYLQDAHSVNFERDDGSFIYMVFNTETLEVFTVEILIDSMRFVWISPKASSIKLDDSSFHSHDSKLIREEHEMTPETLKLKYM